MSGKRKKPEIPSKIPVGTFRLSTVWMRVLKVDDGNTIQGMITFRRWWFKKVRERVIVRLNGITCPELYISQARSPDEYAVEIAHYVKRHIEGEWVKVVIARKHTKELIRETYIEKTEPRLLAFIHPTFLRIKWPVSLNAKLVRKGWARRYGKPEWMTKEYHRQLLRAERTAKRRRAGVWTNHEAGAEPMSWSFWIGFILGALVGFAACFLLLNNRG